MAENPLIQLHNHGQSVWLDQISRALLDSGDLQRMVEAREVTGVTSNPTIFNNAISGSADYDGALRETAAREPDADVEAVYEWLVVRDIRDAADVLRPVYDRSDGLDGYVSLEVSPRLAHDTEATVTEARRLFAEVDRPNLMVKVPATAEGLPAVTQLLGDGINVNVTLMFSQQDYTDVAEAYLSGLEAAAHAGRGLKRIASVASFFVSRIDSKVDALLPPGSPLRGRTAVANTKVAYQLFQKAFASERYVDLRAKEGRRQRFLCASTSTKDPEYRDVLYVEELIGPCTVSTMPPATLAAFRDHGRVRPTMTEDVQRARADLAGLAAAGVDLEQVCRQLQREGVESFSDSFESLLATLEARRTELAASGRG